VRQAYAVGHLAHCRDSRAQVIFFTDGRGRPSLAGHAHKLGTHMHRQSLGTS
jgi:hypothetical protein